MRFVWQFIGGLAFFLYGMSVMGRGLEKASGGRLERLLGRLCSTTFRGILCGALVTALIQSSSATTVMVIGFVNSGMMTLSQAVGVIMGANLGTTFTSWLLSLSGIEGGAWWLQLLKPTTFAPVLAMIGVVFLLQKKRENLRDSGTILLGFAVLMSGMEAMSEAAAPLAQSALFERMVGILANPLLGILFGALMTAVLQSSSAAVGVLQALTVTGNITYGMAVPIVMGQNIGTCITALLSGIGASVNARRASLVHLYFNVIGTAALMLAFFGVEALGIGQLMGKSVRGTDIAAIHTLFNLLSSLLLFPFSGQLEKLAVWSVSDGNKRTIQENTTIEKEKSSEISTFRLLDERFFWSPSFAFDMGKLVFVRMLTLACENVGQAVKCFALQDVTEENRRAVKQEIIENEKVIDAYEADLGAYMLKLSAKALRTEESEQLGNMISALSEVERVGDHAVGLCQSASALYDGQAEKPISEQGREELDCFLSAIKELSHMVCDAYTRRDSALAAGAEPLRAVIDQMRDTLMSRHMVRLRQGRCAPENSPLWTTILTDGVRIAAHLESLSLLLLIKEERGGASVGGYSRRFSFGHTEAYVRQMAAYHEKFKL